MEAGGDPQSAVLLCVVKPFQLCQKKKKALLVSTAGRLKKSQ